MTEKLFKDLELRAGSYQVKNITEVVSVFLLGPAAQKVINWMHKAFVINSAPLTLLISYLSFGTEHGHKEYTMSYILITVRNAPMVPTKV